MIKFGIVKTKKNQYMIMLDLDKKELKNMPKDKIVDKYITNVTIVNDDPEFQKYMSEEEDKKKIQNSLLSEAKESGYISGISDGISEGENKKSIEETIKDEKSRISSCINKELANVGITSKLKGKTYIYDAIMYLIENENNGSNIVTYLSNLHKKSATTITNGIQNAIYHAWRVTPIEDLTKYYTARVNYETGVPTPMEFIYYYKDKIKEMI